MSMSFIQFLDSFRLVLTTQLNHLVSLAKWLSVCLWTKWLCVQVPLQKTLKFYNSWVHWKNQCRLTVRRYSLLCNKHECQHFADIFVKNIFNTFHATGLFLYFLKYIRKPEVSWSFQGTLKGTSAMKWVKSHLIFKYFTYWSNWR